MDEVSAIVLAAGYGKRLRPLTWFTPKPLIKINGKETIKYVIENLNEANIKQIYVNIHYKPLKMLKFFYIEQAQQPLVLGFNYEKKLRGTALIRTTTF